MDQGEFSKLGVGIGRKGGIERCRCREGCTKMSGLARGTDHLVM